VPWVPISAHSAPVRKVVADARVAATPTVAPEDVPQAADLDSWRWEQHRLETDLAGSLGFSVGMAKGSLNSRTLVAEFSRSKTIEVEGGFARYGVAARLVVNVRNFEASANLTLPFVAAQAQYGRLEAYADISVEGYTGDEAGDLFPPFSAFDVETYVKLMDALTAMKGAIGKHQENIRPVQLWAWADVPAEQADDKLTRAVGSAWALTAVAEGWPLQKATEKYRDQDDSVAKKAIESVYAELGIDDPDAAPADDPRQHAKHLLDGYEMHHPFFG
jgi:hypothetical protein